VTVEAWAPTMLASRGWGSPALGRKNVETLVDWARAVVRRAVAAMRVVVVRIVKTSIR